ncbi:hypothetical protein [Pseudomonas fakonensis]|uniref:hypothetical protein n=1 Tax=Pseudomonas fakonensis TaxID=2842355 RepID=UPI001CED367E|nr:hypothetical protein [Pseudomonas fakonensis]
MRWLQFLIVFSPCVYAADGELKECIGRSVFDVPEPVSWATSDIENFRIDGPGFPMFSRRVGGNSGHVRYSGSLRYKVSIVTTRDHFENARQMVLLDHEAYVENLRRRLKVEQERLSTLSGGPHGKAIARAKEDVAKLQNDLGSAGIREFDIGLPDAYVFGNQSPYEAFLWRNNRVYYFAFTKPEASSLQDVKNLMARFEPRDSHQIPKGPGVCMPYGFIHDDGLPTFSIKSSLCFDSTPNVILSIINASPEYETKPTLGTYNTHYYPGYDRQRWKKSSILQAIDLGGHKTVLEGWRLDPRPSSGEEERAWFATANVGGLLRPLLAVHMETFPKGTDDLQTLTPPPEEVIPKFLKITESIRDL